MPADNGTFSGADLAGAVDPGTAKRMSDLGTPGAGTAPDGMVELEQPGGPQAAPVAKRQQRQQTPTDDNAGPDLSQMVDLDKVDQQKPSDDDQQSSDDDQQQQEIIEQPTDDEASKDAVDFQAKYEEWMDSPDLPEEFQDKVMWFDSDGKGDMQPIRVRDIPNNIMMYRDYQRKTAEVAERNRGIDKLMGGFRNLQGDVASGDPERGLRAFRYMGGGKTFEKMVLAFVNERAQLEALPPHMQEQFLEKQQKDDENHYLKLELDRMRLERERELEQQANSQGVGAPDIRFIQQHITETLPMVFQNLGITQAEAQSDLFVHELERVFEQAATGRRDANGSWTEAPTIQRGRTPSTKLIQQLVLAAKQSVDNMLLTGRRKAPPKREAPPTFNGSGPAAKPGQQGNISQPKRMRWSDMGKRQ